MYPQQNQSKNNVAQASYAKQLVALETFACTFEVFVEEDK